MSDMFDEALCALKKLVAIDSVQAAPCNASPFGEGVAKCLQFVADDAKSRGFKVGLGDGYYVWAETGEGDAAARQQDAGADDPADSVAPLPLTLDPAEVQLTLALDAVETGGAGSWGIGAGLKVVDGKLTVDTADKVEEDNTKPVTSAAVFVELGNVEALLAQI